MFILFTLASEAVYLFLVGYVSKSGLVDLHKDSDLFLVLSCLDLLFVLYFLAYFLIDWKKMSISQVVFVVFLANLTLLLTPFISSNDLHSYIFTGRIFSIWGANPYFVQYDAFRNDPLYSQLETIWAHHTVLYGPLFIYFSGLINLIGQNNFSFLTIFFKFLFVGLNVFNAFLIYLLTKEKRIVFLYALNPLVVFELAGNTHTETLTIFLLLISFLTYKETLMRSFFILVASVLIKYVTASFAPFWLIALVKKGWRRLFLAGLAVGAFVILSYWPLWGGMATFDYLRSFYNGQYISPGLGIGLGDLLLGDYRRSFQLNTLIFFAIAGGVFWRFYKSKQELQDVVLGSFIMYWGYLVFKSSLVLYWYLIPAILLGSLLITNKSYARLGLGGILIASLYGLGLYYFVR